MKLSQLKSFEAACKVEGLDSKKVIPDFKFFPEKDREAEKAHAMLVIVISAANRIANGGKEWIADHDDPDQVKYEPYFVGGSSGFRYSDFGYRVSGSCVGSRLCFIDHPTMMHVVKNKNFLKLYKTYYTKKGKKK